MKNNLWRFKKGVTIIELIITVSILAIISVVVIDIYVKSQVNFKIQLSKTNLETATRGTLDIINKYIKPAASVESTYTAPDMTVYNNNSSCIILKIPSIDIDKNIIADTYDYFIFMVNPSNLHQIQQISYTDAASSRDDTNKIIANYLQELEFKYYNSSDSEITSSYENAFYIKTTIVSSEVVNGQTNSIELNTRSKLRNK